MTDNVNQLKHNRRVPSCVKYIFKSAEELEYLMTTYKVFDDITSEGKLIILEDFKARIAN